MKRDLVEQITLRVMSRLCEAEDKSRLLADVRKALLQKYNGWDGLGEQLSKLEAFKGQSIAWSEEVVEGKPPYGMKLNPGDEYYSLVGRIQSSNGDEWIIRPGLSRAPGSSNWGWRLHVYHGTGRTSRSNAFDAGSPAEKVKALVRWIESELKA